MEDSLKCGEDILRAGSRWPGRQMSESVSALPGRTVYPWNTGDWRSTDGNV